MRRRQRCCVTVCSVTKRLGEWCNELCDECRNGAVCRSHTRNRRSQAARAREGEAARATSSFWCWHSASPGESSRCDPARSPLPGNGESRPRLTKTRLDDANDRHTQKHNGRNAVERAQAIPQSRCVIQSASIDHFQQSE